MRTQARQAGFDEIMSLTWFCHRPRHGQPCGTCNPCIYTIEEGTRRARATRGAHSPSAAHRTAAPSLVGAASRAPPEDSCTLSPRATAPNRGRRRHRLTRGGSLGRHRASELRPFSCSLRANRSNRGSAATPSASTRAPRPAGGMASAVVSNAHARRHHRALGRTGRDDSRVGDAEIADCRARRRRCWYPRVGSSNADPCWRSSGRPGDDRTSSWCAGTRAHARRACPPFRSDWDTAIGSVGLAIGVVIVSIALNVTS